MKNKSITNCTILMFYIWNVGLFVLAWKLYYNGRTFQAHLESGMFMAVLMYVLVYTYGCRVYSAFKVASSSISESVFSNCIVFFASDAICYAQSCLICRRYISVIPMILAFCIQVLGTVVITLVAKNIMIRKIVPSKTLIILGRNISEDEGNDFRNRVLHKYSHLFNIVYVYSELDSDEAIKQSIKECDTVFLYEIQSSEREKYMIMCMEQGVDFYFSPNLGDILCQGSESKHIFDTPIYKYKYGYKNGSLEVAKRIFDVTLSIILLIISLPISIFIAIVIKVEDGGPIYYIQERVTKDGKRFKMIKFRSMIVDAEKVGAQPCSDGDSRITRVGRWIRATRLDELPQFINILKGDMSLVGPRPERVEHVTKYTEMLPEFSYRLRVKGGLTGYAQVYGKYNTTPYDKLRLDLMYIENQSILLDLKIIALTIKTIFSKESTEGFQIDEKTKQ